jgi:hypothetical protein
MDERYAKARNYYIWYTGNHPTTHSNRFPTWEELSPEEQATWLDAESPPTRIARRDFLTK